MRACLVSRWFRDELETVKREERKYSGRMEAHGVTRPGEWEKGHGT